MTKEYLLARLREMEGGDPENDHAEADRLLLDFINDPEIAAAYKAIPKWYA